MRKFVVILTALMLFVGQAAFSQETGKAQPIGISIDGGAGISFGLMKSTGASTDALAGLATFLATLRGAAYGTARYQIVDNLSAGVQVGLYAITYESGGVSSTLIDLPLHGLVRYELGPIAAEVFGGYYLSTIKSADYNFGGAEIGAKLFLGGLYGSYSMVLANPEYSRIELGFQLSKIFSF